MKNIFLKSRLIVIITSIIALFALSFFVEILFQISQVILFLLLVFIIVDAVLLFNKKGTLDCKRKIGKVFSLNDDNKVTLVIKNNFPFKLSVEIIDEIPYQFQERDFSIKTKIKPGETKNLKYNLVPQSRGQYQFENSNIYIASPLKFIVRRIIHNNFQSIPVYPSIVQMKKFQLSIHATVKQFDGLKKIQRIGHSYEFDHIKNYVLGDDPRSLNWKASSRRNELMVNYYEDEKSQQVYCILNKSRLMNMPFNGLSLLDYSINTCLTISNIVLQKSDKVGLLSFSDKIGTVIKSERGGAQLRKILNALYNESESNLDPNYELLYNAIRHFIPVRSLLLLFTNFETADSLERNMSILRRINKFHLLVLIIFENTELNEYINDIEVRTDLEIHNKVIARKIQNEKEIICSELRNHGIQYIRTKPEELSINTINKYLELKSRGLI